MLDLKLQIPEKAEVLFTPGWFFKVLYGGRVGAKSNSIAQAALVQAIEQPQRWVCAREIQNSIDSSVLALLREWIYKLGANDFFTVGRNEITGRNGSLFTFEGLRTNVESLKSIPSINRVWVEEAAKISRHSWEVLIPTITRTKGSEIWVSFNPELESDVTSQMFLVPDSKDFRKDALVVRMNWCDNPWFDVKSCDEKDRAYATDLDIAENIWGGEFLKHSNEQVFAKKWVVEDFDYDSIPVNKTHLNFGADWGFGPDPACIVRCFMASRKLYIEYEWFGHHVEFLKLPLMFQQVPGWYRKAKNGFGAVALQNVKIISDCSQPGLIDQMQRLSVPCVPALKGTGSVEDGINFIRGFDQIVIHPRCKHMIEEAKKYRYKTDKVTGEILPDIVDKHNHGWDAVRYALEPYSLAAEQETVFSFDGMQGVNISTKFEHDMPRVEQPAFAVVW